MEYVPAGGGNGRINDGTVWGSMDGENWNQVATGATARTSHGITDIILDSRVEARYVRLGGTSTYHWRPEASNTIVTAAEFKVYGEEQIDISFLVAKIEELDERFEHLERIKEMKKAESEIIEMINALRNR